MSDRPTAGPRPHGSTGDEPDPNGQAVLENLGASVARLRTALDRLSDEVEANAEAEWVRAKPELRQGIDDLQTMVDQLSQRAKAALGDLGARLDDRTPRDDD